MHGLHAGPAELDDERIGPSFIDVLFAFIVGYVASLAIDETKAMIVPTTTKGVSETAAFVQLMVAFVLTVTSWVGYHGSHQRSRYKLKFVNLPLLQFTVDVLLLGGYAAAALTTNSAHVITSPSEAPQAIAIALVFLGYLVWDLLAEWMRLRSMYAPSAQGWRGYLDGDGHRTRSYRLYVTIVFVFITAMVAVAAWRNEPSGGDVTLYGVLTMVVLIAYRFVQDFVGGKQDARLLDEQDKPVSVRHGVAASLHGAAADLEPRLTELRDLLQQLHEDIVT